MLHALKVQADLISVESSTPETIYSAVTNFFPRLVDGVKNFASGIFTDSAAPAFQLTDIKSVERKILASNYVQMSPIAIPVPSGLAITIPEYIKIVEEGVDIIERISDDVLVPFTTWLSVLLTNPDVLRSLKASVNIPGLQWHNIDGLQKSFAKAFDKTAIAEKPYGSMYRRNADYVEAVRDSNTISERVARIDRKNLIKQMETAVSYLERIIENTKTDPERYKVSGPVLDTLSKLTYQVAREIELYSIVAFSVQALGTAIEDGNDKLKRILNP